MTKVMGEVVSWSAISNSMQRSDFLALMKAQSLPVVLPPRDRVRVVERALRGYLQDGKLVQLGTDKWRIAYAIVEEVKDLHDAAWRAKMTEAITYWKKTGKVTFKRGANHDLVPLIQQAITDSENLVFTADIGRAVGATLRRAGGVQIASAGGTWFVPQGARNVVDSLAYVVNRVAEQPNNDIVLFRFAVPRNKRNIRNIRALAERVISNMVNEASLESLMMLRGRQRAVRKEAVTRRIERSKEFSRRIVLFEDMLGVRLVKQRDAVAGFNDVVKQMITYKIGE